MVKKEEIATEEVKKAPKKALKVAKKVVQEEAVVETPIPVAVTENADAVVVAADDSKLMVPLDNYLKAGLHIGTKFRTKYMEKFIYKVRSDGLTVLNVQAIDERIRVVADFISRYNPEDIVVVGKRENGWRAIKLFAKVTGVKAFAGRYHPGILTNPSLEDFEEARLVIVTDPWPDKDALKDAAKVGAVTIALCDTNNDSTYVDLMLPCNNKGRKSLGLIFWILARAYLKKHKPEVTEMPYTIDDFMGENEEMPVMKKRSFVPRRDGGQSRDRRRN